MPAINIEDLSEKDKLKMEVEQLRKEVKLERQPVSGRGEGARSCLAGGGAGCGAGSEPVPPRAAGLCSSVEPRLLWDGRGLHRRSCHRFGSGAGDGAVGTAPLTPRRSAGPSRAGCGARGKERTIPGIRRPEGLARACSPRLFPVGLAPPNFPSP